ncbi:PREDICTED: nuclear factor related to kappa-B-binding protein isoform X2 [Papilio xuthus]|uniref:Nuclear factor related to kappa-B-binding protein isoform X2 n=1 Tax=Papilio xuthus TaxID=66420 RepID=A0AAJ6ZI93_PAPXU|nr:PREDICTED: nuclear factor related to kappa-B-binding protein isoform X2 [Papilio xuthus]
MSDKVEDTEEKMESEQSYSSESSSSSSSDSSSGSSECDEELMEPVSILGHTLELPQELCEDYSIFKEFFSIKTWDSLEDKHKEELTKLLPQFKNDQEEENEKTLKMLFNHEPFHFTSPLSNFYNNLRQGNYRPDIARMRKFLKKARAKQQKQKNKSYYAKLLPELLISRERLLAAVKGAPPGPIPKLPVLAPKASNKNKYKPLYMRVKQRYFEELAAIWGEVGGEDSEDQNYPEGAPERLIKKKKQTVTGQQVDNNVSGTLGGSDPAHLTSLECLKKVLSTHRSRRQYRENHPELNTAGITLEDIKQRVAMMNGTKKLMFGGAKTESPINKLRKGAKKELNQKASKTDSKSAIKKSKEDQDSIENKPLLPNIKIKCEPEESDSESSSFLDPVSSPKFSKKLLDHSEIKQETLDNKYPNYTNSNYNDSKLEIKQEPMDYVGSMQNSKVLQPVPIKLEDLDGIDMMALPIELADESGEVLPVDTSTETNEDNLDADELTETTHANFLALVRALFPAKAAHRASKQQLQARCAAVMRSPIAPLNTWYNLSDDWCGELNSALDFLAGQRGPHPDDFVPYLQFIPESQTYQWIGAGRDCDAILGRLCERWLRAVSPHHSTDPPPPRYPTSWTVRAPTPAEIADFRAQERKRFASATKPFTYVQYGYRSVVGPIVRAAGGGATGALVCAQRPRGATFGALLRDALARLPNGQGTRTDLVTLLKMSQWIAPCTEQALSSAVSAALEKLLAVKRDPIVKYDQRTAVWTYLHRNRSEEDWLKTSGPRGRGGKTIPIAPPVTSPQTAMEMEVASVEEVIENASDSDVDVDDSGPSPAPHLSSAQLLMQATQATQVKLTHKQKGKLVATPTPKTKNLQPKQTQIKTPQIKQTLPKQNTQTNMIKVNQTQKKPNITQIKQTAKQINTVPKQIPIPKQSPKQTQAKTPETMKIIGQSKANETGAKSYTSVVVTPKPKAAQKIEASQSNMSSSLSNQHTTMVSIVQPASVPSIQQTQAKMAQVTRSLLIRPSSSSAQTTSTVTTLTINTPPTQTTPAQRRGVVRVLSPATPSSGKSLISPQALMPQNSPTAKKRTTTSTTPVSSLTQTSASVTTVVSSVPTVVTSSVSTRTVQLAGGRTVQLATNQTVHLPSGQAVQLTPGHTLQLSSLQLPTHSVRLPSGQTVQLAAPQTVRAVATTQVKNPSPRPQNSSPTIKSNPQTSQSLQIPVSTVQLGQTVQIAGQTVQLAGQSVQLTGHTVKLPSGQSVQVASQSVLPSQSVQTVQLAGGNVQTVQLSGQSVQLSGQSGQMSSGQSVLASPTVQIGGQTVQLSGQTVQLPSGQTFQLPSGQTVQLSSGQTIQLASGQTIQLANQTPKSISQSVRTQSTGDKTSQPIVAKLLTNAQGQMISLEGVVGGARALQVAGVANVGNMSGVGNMSSVGNMGGMSNVRGRGSVRVLSPSTRLARPLLLTSAKPLHNIILQQSDGSSIRMTSSGGTATSQTIVLSNIGGQTVTTSTSSPPVLKLQQVNQMHPVRLPQGIKIQQAVPTSSVPTSSGVRSVLMDGQQLKLVGGRHVLARLLRPANPPQ